VNDKDGAQLLAERLTATGVPVPRSSSFAEVKQGFQSWVRHRQLLVVVDHVASTHLLALLRPSGDGSALVAVNRFGIPGQVGDSVVEVAPLSPAASRSLLARTAGEDRIQADDEAVTTLTDLCEGNPFALSAVGRWVCCRGQIPLARLVRELEQDRRRLARLWWGGRSIEESVRTYLRCLSEDAVHVLSALSRYVIADVCPRALAAALDIEQDRAEAVLDELAGVHLVNEVTPADARPVHRTFRIRSIVHAAMPAPTVDRVTART
jgi:hypothetical protein